MVIDNYYGLRVYITEVKDVPILDDTVEYAPKLYVNTKNITGVAANYNGITGAEVAYLRDITDLISANATGQTVNYVDAPINSEMFTKGNVLKIKTTGTKTIRTVAEDGRVYDLIAVVDSATSDATDLENLIEKARKYLNTYRHEETAADDNDVPIGRDRFKDYYVDEKIPGAWAEDVAWKALETAVKDAVDLINYDGKIDKDSFTTPTQKQIDDAYTALYNAIYKEDTGFLTWSVVNEEELIKVDGDTITVLTGDLAQKGRDVEYVIYSAKDVYDISTEIQKDYAYRPINATVWDSWAGISSQTLRNYWERRTDLAPTDPKYYGESGEYNQYNTPKDNIVITGVPNGVYTFQIKVDGVVYYRNPVVHKDVTDELTVVKDYLGGSDGEGGLIKEAKDLLASVYSKKEYDGDNNKTPYISTTWENILKNEINEAKLYYEKAGTRRYNKGTSYKPVYINCDQDGVIKETATLHNTMRKFIAAIGWGDTVHTIHMMKAGRDTEPNENNDFETINTTNGIVEVINDYSTHNGKAYAKATKIIVAKGRLKNWSEMAQAGTSTFEWTPVEGEDAKLKSQLNVHANGTYTVYVKYDDNVYEFYYFTITGYNYPITAAYNESTKKIDITVKAGLKINELQIADGTYTAYTRETTTIFGEDVQTGTDQAFRDLWYTYPSGVEPIAANRTKRTGFMYSDTKNPSNNKIGDSGYTNSQFTISLDRLSISEHTVYASILNNDSGEYEEYFIPVAVSNTPIIYRESNDVFTAMTTVGNVSWVAYAIGDHLTKSVPVLDGEANHWDRMVNAGVHYMAQNMPVKIDGLGANDITFYFKGANGNKNYIVLVTNSHPTPKYYDGDEDTSYHVGAKVAEKTDDVFEVAGASSSGIRLSKKFDASSDGTKIAYYKIRASKASLLGRDAATEIFESSEFMPAPTNGQTLPLPSGLVTKVGDIVYYQITFYDSGENVVATLPAEGQGSYTITFDAAKDPQANDDVYAVKSASDAGVVIYQVNAANGGKSSTQYSIQVKNVNDPADKYTAAGELKPIPSGGKIDIPETYITERKKTKSVSGVDYIIKLYSETDSENAVQTITGTYKLVVNAEYRVLKQGLTTTDRVVTLTTGHVVQAANGGKEAKVYALFYADKDGNEVAPVKTDGDTPVPVRGPMANTIKFKNLECYNKVMVKFYDDEGSDTAFTPAVCSITDLVDEVWTVTGSREYESDVLTVTFTRTQQSRTGGKQVANYKILNHEGGAPIATNEPITTTNFTSRNAANSVDVYMMTATGEVLYIFREVNIKKPEAENEKYVIDEINVNTIKVKQESDARYGGKTVDSAKIIYKAKGADSEITKDAPDIFSGLKAESGYEWKLTDDSASTPGKEFEYTIEFYSGAEKIGEIKDSIFIPKDDVFAFDSVNSNSETIKFKRTSTEAYGGKKAATYTVTLTGDSKSENIIKNKTAPSGVNIVINCKATLEVLAGEWGWTVPDSEHTVKVDIEFFNEKGESIDSINGEITYTVPSDGETT